VRNRRGETCEIQNENKVGKAQSLPEFLHLSSLDPHSNACTFHKAKEIIPKVVSVSLLLLLWSLSLPVIVVDASCGYSIITGDRDHHTAILTLRYRAS
jgi:hypothetical protein